MRLIFTSLLLVVLCSYTYTQCEPYRHNTSFDSNWGSCAKRMSPNDARGNSHWFMMELDEPYTIGESWIWNVNNPDHLSNATQTFTIDVSLDGSTWNEIGTYTLEQANGSGHYQGEAGPNFESSPAKYILYTLVSSYGSDDCIGLGEVKIELLDQYIETSVVSTSSGRLNLSPNPASSYIAIDGLDKQTKYRIYSADGTLVKNGSTSATIDVNDIPTGIYMIELYTTDGKEQLKFNIQQH